jgi:hypothetical protein
MTEILSEYIKGVNYHIILDAFALSQLFFFHSQIYEDSPFIRFPPETNFTSPAYFTCTATAQVMMDSCQSGS